MTLHHPATPDFGFFGQDSGRDQDLHRNYLHVGRRVVYYKQGEDICGRLRWHTWETEEGERLVFGEHVAVNAECPCSPEGDLVEAPDPAKVVWLRSDGEYAGWEDVGCEPPTLATLTKWVKSLKPKQPDLFQHKVAAISIGDKAGRGTADQAKAAADFLLAALKTEGLDAKSIGPAAVIGFKDSFAREITVSMMESLGIPRKT